MVQPAVPGPQKSYSIGRKRLVTLGLRCWQCPLVAMGFQLFAYFRKLGMPPIMHISEGH